MNIEKFEKFEIELTCKKCGSKDVTLELGGYMGDAIIQLTCKSCQNEEEEIS